MRPVRTSSTLITPDECPTASQLPSADTVMHRTSPVRVGVGTGGGGGAGGRSPTHFWGHAKQRNAIAILAEGKKTSGWVRWVRSNA